MTTTLFMTCQVKRQSLKKPNMIILQTDITKIKNKQPSQENIPFETQHAIHQKTSLPNIKSTKIVTFFTIYQISENQHYSQFIYESTRFASQQILNPSKRNKILGKMSNVKTTLPQRKCVDSSKQNPQIISCFNYIDQF